MADLLMVEAINDALHVELGRDDAVMVMGEDVGRSGGVFRATAGLRPISSQSIPYSQLVSPAPCSSCAELPAQRKGSGLAL